MFHILIVNYGDKMGKITFIIGGAKSGKTAYAINLAKRTNQQAAYIATAPCHDDSMKSRIYLNKKESAAG